MALKSPSQLYWLQLSIALSLSLSLFTGNAEASTVKQKSNRIKVEKSDPSYQKLVELNSKYDCGADAEWLLSPDRRSVTRSEFIRAIDACTQAIEDRVAQAETTAPPAPETTPETAPQPSTVSPEDLEKLKSIIAAFRSEMDLVDLRIQTLESRVENGFSTTTKLAGEVILGLNTYGGGTGNLAAGNATALPAGNRAAPSNTVFANRVRLNFDTSFFGQDRLRTRLQSRNNVALSGAGTTGTNMTRLGYDGDEGNATSVSLLQYTVPLTSEVKAIVETVGSEFNENMYTFNPLLASSGGGSISRFGRYNPVYRLSGDGAAITLDYQFSPDLGLAVGYAVPGNSAANPAQTAATAPALPVENGIFSGSNAIISQLSYRPNPDLGLGLIYARSYHANGTGVSGSTGSSGANSPFGAVRTTANHYSLLASYKFGEGDAPVVSGWLGSTNATRETAPGGRADSLNYALNIAFPNFGGKGNTLGFIFGMPPKLTGRTGTGLGLPDRDSAFHIETLYKFKLSDNLEMTPGILVITNPENNRLNPTEYVGTLRTTFKF
jgi:hypothetical protein